MFQSNNFCGISYIICYTMKIENKLEKCYTRMKEERKYSICDCSRSNLMPLSDVTCAPFSELPSNISTMNKQTCTFFHRIVGQEGFVQEIPKYFVHHLGHLQLLLSSREILDGPMVSILDGNS